jgi:hypothetical protein
MRVYTKLGLVLIGLELRSPVTDTTRILLNPSGMSIPDVVQYAVQGIVIADSVDSASELSRGDIISSVKSLRLRQEKASVAPWSPHLSVTVGTFFQVHAHLE